MRTLYVFGFLLLTLNVTAQNFQYKGMSFVAKNVNASVASFQGEEVIKVERDLYKLGFDLNRLESTVDEPTYVRILNLDFSEGTIEFKMYSAIQNPSPFAGAQGFIGAAFRIAQNDTAYESIYLRPKVGRSLDQYARNHTVQYYSYPRFKFQTLRTLKDGKYESAAPVNINEWISVRIVVKGDQAELFINNAPYSYFIVDRMLGSVKSGGVAFWVDIATIGYFKEIKVSPL